MSKTSRMYKKQRESKIPQVQEVKEKQKPYDGPMEFIRLSDLPPIQLDFTKLLESSNIPKSDYHRIEVQLNDKHYGYLEK